MIKAQLNRIALRAADADKAVEDLGKLLGVTFYGPYDDEHMGLRVALPKSGGIEVMAPMHDHDAIGAYQKLQEVGEGVSGIAVRVENFDEAKEHFASMGLKPAVEFNHGKFREMIFPPQPTALKSPSTSSRTQTAAPSRSLWTWAPTGPTCATGANSKRK